MSEVKIVTLLNGQEIVGTIHYVGDNIVHMDKPAAVLTQQQPNGQISLGLAPWPALADPNEVKKNGVDINRDLVVTVNTPNKDLLSGYNQTMTGLLVPRAPTLIVE